MSSTEEKYNLEYLATIEDLNGDEAGRRAAWERMGRGTSFWDGEPTAFSYLPRLFSAQSRERLERTAQMTYRILTKAIERYRTDEAFRREFRLDPRVEELVLLPRKCPEPLPFARVDFAYDEETGSVRAIEFNTDSSSGMNENREALRALRDTEPFKRFAAKHTVRDDVDQHFSGWVERFALLRAQADAAGAAGAAGAGNIGDAGDATGVGSVDDATGVVNTANIDDATGAQAQQCQQAPQARQAKKPPQAQQAQQGQQGEQAQQAPQAAHAAQAAQPQQAAQAQQGQQPQQLQQAAQAAQSAQAHMALVACLDSPNPDIGELETYRELFEQAGMPCSVFDVRQLEFDGQRLVGRTALAGPSNVTIDCVWRWVIVVDLLEHWDDVQPFIQAVRAQKAELIGSFATQIAHDKQLFAVLHRVCANANVNANADADESVNANADANERANVSASADADANTSASSWLTAEEQAFVRESIPYTAFLDDPALDVEAIRREPERWVVKPTDWYESKRVVAGRDCTQAEWEQALDAYAQEVANGALSPYIVQEFCAPCQTPAIPIRGLEGDFTAEPVTYGNVVGLYVQAGTFAGAYVRQGPHAVIGSAREGLVTPVLWVD